nr:DUF2530 domain-containing protein [Longispora albida]
MESRPEPEPLDLPGTPFAVAGIALWAVAWVAVKAFGGSEVWGQICLAGVLVGIPGLLTMIVHDRGRRNRKQREAV